MEKQALRSSICFSSTVNEQTVCESRQEVRSAGLRVFSKWKNKRSRESAKADKKCEARVCEFFHNGKKRCEAAFVFTINMDGWKL